MRYGPLVFLGLLFALALSWLGMVATPQLQLGNQQPTNLPPANVIYPTPHPGLANAGREIYRANGCAYCHSQVIRQDGIRFDLVIVNPGSNQTAVVEELVRLRSGLSAAEAGKLLDSTPATVWTLDDKRAADSAQKTLNAVGAEAAVRVVPMGADIERGWGTRLSVAHDYIYDTPVMLGLARIGPDLTNIGLRRPDPVWHLVHLFDPKLRVDGSTMPKYPFLFERRPRGRQPAPDALPIPGDQDIVPTPAARALVAYLMSLRAEMPLFEAPGPQMPSTPSGAGDTNAVAGTGTNAPSGAAATNSPAASQAAPR